MRRPFVELAFTSLRSAAMVTPKQDNLVLFGARKGNWYTDCSRRVYEKMVSSRPDLRPVWMTRNKTVYERLKKQGYPVCRMGSLRSYYLLSRAPLAVISTQLYDIARFPSMIPDSLRLVFLGHGKSSKASTLAFRSGRSPGFKRMFERTGQLTDVAVSTSPFTARLSARANGFPEERYIVTGYPRNDPLIDPEPRLRERWYEYLDGLHPAATCLYAPTWRQRGERTRFFPFEDLDERELLGHLERNRTLLLLRPHERDLLNQEPLRRFLKNLEQKSDWVRICDQENYQDVNHVLPFTDALITDYSSICNDYLLLDRPMIFIPYDFSEFEQTQGFMYDYFGTLPGPATYTQKGLLDRLDQIIQGRDPYREKRRALREKIHTHVDAESTHRVLGLIDKRLGRNGQTNPEPTPNDPARIEKIRFEPDRTIRVPAEATPRGAETDPLGKPRTRRGP